jgi:uncharacterized protein (TIGR03437 family)
MEGYANRLALLLCVGTLWAPAGRAQLSPNAPAGPPTVTVNFVTTASSPLNPGFNGFNSNLNNAVEYYDPNFQQIMATLSPGWLRYPGGTESEAFDWTSGEIVSAWVDALAAKQYTHDINAGAQSIVAGKGGSSFGDFAALATKLGGAKIIVSVNAYTDTPQSAQAFAQFALANHIPVAVWELANEPYTWAGSGAFFTDATDYANKMKPYRDAIKAADPNAVVSIYFSEAGHPDKAWDNALAGYSSKYWDAVTYHEYVFPGTLTTFNDLMAAANGNLFSNTTSYVTDYLAPKNKAGMTFQISEVSPSGGQGGPLLGTLYGGIYSAEFALRMSTLPQVKYVAAFQMISNAGIDEGHNNLKVVQNAYQDGTTANTSGLNFGFFVSAQAAGEAVANGALHNSIGVYTTTTTGGPSVTTDSGASIPAVYAQAYQGGNGKRYVVLTNKGAAAAVAQITQDGAVPSAPMQMTFVTGTDPTLTNAGRVPDNVQIQTQTVTAAGAVTIPPYSVARLEWTVSTLPLITAVRNSASGNAAIAPNTWTTIDGANLAPAGDARVWTANDFVKGNMPASLDGVSVTVNGKAAFVYYISPSAINILTPPDAITGTVQVQVTFNGVVGPAFQVVAQSIDPAFFLWDSYVVATHADYSLVGPATLFPGLSTPAKPGETIVLWANGFGATSTPVVSGSTTQSGTLAVNPTIRIAGKQAAVTFAGLVSEGLFQFNVTVPTATLDGDQSIIATYNGASTQIGTFLTVLK